jgi:DNA-binding Xre family transcriptional regulator
MRLSYNKLWKLLIDKNMNKTDLKEKAEISAGTVARLGKDENVNTSILLKICTALDCDLNDIVETVRDEKRV